MSVVSPTKSVTLGVREGVARAEKEATTEAGTGARTGNEWGVGSVNVTTDPRTGINTGRRGRVRVGAPAAVRVVPASDIYYKSNSNVDQHSQSGRCQGRHQNRTYRRTLPHQGTRTRWLTGAQTDFTGARGTEGRKEGCRPNTQHDQGGKDRRQVHSHCRTPRNWKNCYCHGNG